METIPFVFDTYRFVKRLVSEGFTEGQAEVLIESYQHLFAVRLEDLVTQQDVANCATKQDIERVAIKLENIERLLKTVLQNKT